MHRCYVEPGQASNATLTLSDREAHHATNVLRLKVRDRIVALDGQGSEFLCEIADISRKGGQLKVLSRTSIRPLPYQLTLIQAVPKGKAMENIVQKATELGAIGIVPLLSERTVVQLDDEDAGAKVEKWTETCIEAIKQCGSAWLPKIDPPTSPTAFLNRGERFDLQLLASLQSDTQHPRAILDAYFEERKKHATSIAIWVGPEGDFTPAEINMARNAGALPVTLGPLVLRSDTAAIYSLSVLNYEMQARLGLRVN
ncbi:MAG TPA: RsmE family RNA methyltransferase [Methylomirabilota bacterium]|nr:RsmE family RNA methyltransferase [Methylomirabilota bacterium]